MIGYIFFFIFCFIYLVGGLYIIIRHKPNMHRYFDFVISAMVISTYVFAFIETLSNSNINNFYTQALLPTHNYRGIVFIIFSLTLLLKNCKLKDFLLVFSSILGIAMLFAVSMEIVDYSQWINSPQVYSRVLFLMLGEITIFLYSIYVFIKRPEIFKIKYFVGSLSLMLVIYSIMLICSYCLSTNYFGMSFKDNGYLYSAKIIIDQITSIWVNYLFIVAIMTINFIIFFLLKKQSFIKNKSDAKVDM